MHCSGELLLAGSDLQADGSTMWVARYRADGALAWSSAPGPGSLHAIAGAPDGDVLVAGTTPGVDQQPVRWVGRLTGG